MLIAAFMKHVVFFYLSKTIQTKKQTISDSVFSERQISEFVFSFFSKWLQPKGKQEDRMRMKYGQPRRKSTIGSGRAATSAKRHKLALSKPISICDDVALLHLESVSIVLSLINIGLWGWWLCPTDARTTTLHHPEPWIFDIFHKLHFRTKKNHEQPEARWSKFDTQCLLLELFFKS